MRPPHDIHTPLLSVTLPILEAKHKRDMWEAPSDCECYLLKINSIVNMSIPHYVKYAMIAVQKKYAMIL